MKKLFNVGTVLTVLLVALMSRAAFAFVPLSNSQNIGSYQRGATRGTFCGELDIISAAPVELLDFSGNTLYTNWGNVRNFNDIANYGTALDWSTANQWRNNNDVSYFTFGVTGNPLSYAGIEDSRSGIVYQNFGGKTVTFNLDDDVNTGQNPTVTGEDSEGTWETKNYIVVWTSASMPNDRVVTANSDAKYNLNTTNTQWNAGSSYKMNDKISLGLSLAKQTDTNILTTEGTKTYSAKILTATGADALGLPISFAGVTGVSYNFAYPTQDIDQNSTSTTDILPQARVKISDDFYVDAGVGLRFAKTLNPGTIVANEKDVVTVTATELTVAFSTSPTSVGPAEYYNTGTAIVGKTAVAAVSLDYDEVTNIGPTAALNSTVFNTANWADADDGISAFSDDRDGTAPLVRIEAVKKFEKVDVTGIVNYSNLSQDIDASQTDREYIQTSCIISTWTNNTIADGTIKDNFVSRDYSAVTTYKGKGTRSNFDVGAKVSMKALEGLKLSFGGFIQRQSDKTDVDTNVNSTELTSYDDGIVSTNVYLNGTVVSASSGTIAIATRPGPVAGTDQTTSRGLVIDTSGEGEGTWSQTITGAGDNQVTETITTNYRVPVGVEIPLSKKWTFRAGTEYVMTKTEVTSETTTNGKGIIQTTATPGNGEAAVIDTQTASYADASTKSIYRTENHDVFYTYGVQFDATPSLTIACNAFLDTAADVVGTANASIFDLTTYRQLSLSAAIKF